MQGSIGVGISLPRKIMAQIDSERGDVSRSRFLLRMIEAYAQVAKKGREKTSNEMNDDEIRIAVLSYGTPERNSSHV
jgi:metal-responsive CopG/Arc/MetJ family transcriptional regulator